MAKYTKRWKGKDGKWQYSYETPGSKVKGFSVDAMLRSLLPVRSGLSPKDQVVQRRIDLMDLGETLREATSKLKVSDEDHLRYYIVRKEMLKEKLVSPGKIVGSGYKNPRKIANDWLDKQISEYREKVSSVKKSQEDFMEGSKIALVVIPGGLSKSSHQHPAGTSKVNAGIKSPIPYEGHEARMKFARMAAARMLGAQSPESAREYADNPTVDHKGREKGQKAPHDNYGTSVSGMGSQSHALYAKPTFIVSPSELGSSAPESASKYTPVRHAAAPKK